MKIQDYLLINDPYYRLLQEEKKLYGNNDIVLPHTALHRIRLRLYADSHWSIRWTSQSREYEVVGNKNLHKNTNSREVNILHDILQTEFKLSKIEKSARRDCVYENKKVNLDWQIIWIEDIIRHYHSDKPTYQVDRALIIYGNEYLWECLPVQLENAQQFNVVSAGRPLTDYLR